MRTIWFKSSMIFIFLLVMFFSHRGLLFAGENTEDQQSSQFYNKFKFEHLSVNDGLSSNNTAAIVQDHQGFVWIGTTDGGVNKYDGVRFINYVNQPGNPASLPNNYAWRLYTDKKGRIWVVSWGGGLSCYNPEKDTFVNYRHEESDEDSLSSNLIWSVLVDNKDRVWVGTDKGLDRYDPASGKFVHYRHIPGDPSSLSHNKVSMIRQSSDGFLWISTYGGGLNKFDPEKELFTAYKISAKGANGLGHDFVWTMIEDSNGFVWLGTEGGLYRFDSKTKAFTQFFKDGKDYIGGLITELFEDDRKRIWIGTSGRGLRLYQIDSGTVETFRHDQDNPYSLADETIWGIHQDVTGAIWFATFNGVNRYDERSFRFDHYQRYPGVKNSLSTNSTQVFCEGKNGIIWIGTRGGGVNRFDSVNKTFTHFLQDPQNPDSLSNNTVLDIIVTDNNALWIGTSAGLDLFNPKNESFIHYQNDPDDPATLNHGNVWDIDIGRDNILWIGLYGGGLDRFDPVTETFTHFIPDKNDSNSLISEWVTTVFVDSDGMIWAGTEGGLSRLDPETGEFTNFLPNFSDPNSLSDSTIHTIFQDNEDRLWIGTNKGLNRFIKEMGKFKRYGTQDGLPGDISASIIEDNQGALWIGTNQGLSKFDPKTKKFRNYDARDGLQGNQFLRKAALRDADGQLFFGGVNGFNSFYPEKLHENPYIPPVKLTEFRLFNKPVNLNGTSPLKRHINVAKNIVLSHDQTMFSFKFASLNYLSPGKNKYAYRMEGFDKDWNYVDSDQQLATYTNLDPGSYLFKVKGSNNDSVWNEKGTSIKITILPPWWETLWFKCVLFISFIGLIVIVSQWRVRTISANKRQLEVVVNQRTLELARIKERLEDYNRELENEVENRIEELYESRETYRRLIKDLPIGVFRSRPHSSHSDNMFLMANPFLAKILDYESVDELMKLTISDVYLDPRERQSFIDRLAEKKSVRDFEIKIKKRDGSPILVAITARTVLDGIHRVSYIEGVAEDITNKKRAEQQLRQVQKMEAIGNLAGGIAHDFNNILAPIVGMSEILIDDLAPNSPEQEMAQEILKASLRATELVRQILAFSRQTEYKVIPVKIQSVLREVLKLCRATIPSDIEIMEDIQDDCSHVKADPTQIHQVAMNLITNAYHAIEGERGKIAVHLKEFELSQSDLPDSSLKPGRYAHLAISDTGCGIDSSIIDKIFNPYFTTKEQGKGTGLGLATVYGIVREDQGDIKVYSELGKGSTFNIYLPVIEETAEIDTATKIKRLQTGKERILFVDDEEPIVDLQKIILERLGYQVTSFTSSIEALKAFHSDPKAYDLVITDMTMPQMTGDLLSRELREIRSDVPILICTGFSDRIDQHQSKIIGIDGFLMKPIVKSELSKKIREIFNNKSF